MAFTASTPGKSVLTAESTNDASRVVRSGSLLWLGEEESHTMPAFTLLVWLSCVLVGLLGFVLHYDRPRQRTPPSEPLLAQQLQVELDPPTPPEIEPPPLDPLTPPPPPDALAPSAIVQPIAVAQPGPAIAFAVPVPGPTRIVDANRAEYASRPVVSTQAAPQPVKQLILGEGEGKQPKPDYPDLARRRRQEGTVVVRLSVGEDGRVASAEAVEPSPWPLLNEAALKVVRERWRFPVGPARLYEVGIHFQIAR
jgi:TonB family protein